MRRWVRATVETVCGGPPTQHVSKAAHRILKGEWMLEIQIRGMTRRLLRCEECAGPSPDGDHDEGSIDEKMGADD